MMGEVERMIARIHNAYAKFREEVGGKPTHFVLSVEARQALKLRYGHLEITHPAATYMGVSIIDLERVIIVGPEGP